MKNGGFFPFINVYHRVLPDAGPQRWISRRLNDPILRVLPGFLKSSLPVASNANEAPGSLMLVLFRYLEGAEFSGICMWFIMKINDILIWRSILVIYWFGFWGAHWINDCSIWLAVMSERFFRDKYGTVARCLPSFPQSQATSQEGKMSGNGEANHEHSVLNTYSIHSEHVFQMLGTT